MKNQSFSVRRLAVSVLAVCAALTPIASSHRLHLANFAPAAIQRFEHALRPLPFLPGNIRDTSAQAFSDESSGGGGSTLAAFPYLTQPSNQVPLTIVKDFIQERFGFLEDEDYTVKDSYTDDHNGVTHIYLKQLVNGKEVTNGDANVNVDRLGRVISFGSSFFQSGSRSSSGASASSDGRRRPASVRLLWGDEDNGGQIVLGNPSTGKKPAPVTDQAVLTASEAVVALTRYLGLPVPDDAHISEQPTSSLQGEMKTIVLGFPFTESNGIPVTQKYIQIPVAKTGSQSKNTHSSSLRDEQEPEVASDTADEEPEATELRLVWDIQVEMEENWYHAHVDAVNGKVLGLMDWVSDASYEAYPIGVNDPLDGNRVRLVNPADKVASPFGWHAKSETVRYTTTMGNNVIAQENLDGDVDNDYLRNYRPDGGSALEFLFPLDLKLEPKAYLNASITNLFVWNNVMHDLFHKYGFDEKSGNFQNNNFGRGGKGGDAVIANAQDGAGYNNANFATPPDGQAGKMRMYVWDGSYPYRDGDLENGIIIHEYGHGISTRLTGGPANSNCLGWGESGGMGEGWGDFWATILRMRPEYTREKNFGMGTYAIGNEKGIRKFVYSTDMSVNPSTYGFIRKFGYIGVHAKGEVWAEILFEMYWNLVDKHGFSKDWYNTEAKGKDGTVAGNVVALQLTVDGLKFQPCRPTFVDARDAILQADEVNYNGDHHCEIWSAFAKRGLGVNARKGGREDFELPAECQ